MDLSSLRIFLAVAEEPSFSRAAAKVHRTQPAVSQAVRRLETDLGDELVLLVPPSHALAARKQVTMEQVAEEPVMAHNDPSPARERVLRLFEERRVPLNLAISLPSLDGIKRAVELKLGVALLPRRCAVTEIASGRLVAVPVTGISRRRQVMLVCRKAHRSHAADAFLDLAQQRPGVGLSNRLI